MTPAEAGDPVVVGWHLPGGWVDVAATIESAPEDGEWVLRMAPMTAATERREHLRVAESSAVEVDAEGQIVAGRIIDLSESGMRCVVGPHRTLEVGDEIVVVFVLDTGSVALDADVVRAATAGGGTEVGLRFHSAHRREVSRIREHVAGRVARLSGAV
jgi:hypothetical protein